MSRDQTPTFKDFMYRKVTLTKNREEKDLVRLALNRVEEVQDAGDFDVLINQRQRIESIAPGNTKQSIPDEASYRASMLSEHVQTNKKGVKQTVLQHQPSKPPSVPL